MSERWQALTPAQKAPYVLPRSRSARRTRRAAARRRRPARRRALRRRDDLKARKRKKRKKKKTRPLAVGSAPSGRSKYKNWSVAGGGEEARAGVAKRGGGEAAEEGERARGGGQEGAAGRANRPPSRLRDELLVVKKKKQKTRRFGAWQEFCKELRPKFPKGTKIPEPSKEMAAIKWKKLTPKQRESTKLDSVRAREAYNAEVAMATPQQPVGSLEDTVPPVKMKKQKTSTYARRRRARGDDEGVAATMRPRSPR